jgi:hypothetical protein
MGLIELINAVPATLWGFVIGSFFTVLGVVLTNAANTKRLRLQHEHEWRLESRERDLNLRRDIYLATMEAMATSIATIGRFGSLNIPSDELELILTDQSPSLSKVSIVGQEATVHAGRTERRAHRRPLALGADGTALLCDGLSHRRGAPVGGGGR